MTRYLLHLINLNVCIFFQFLIKINKNSSDFFSLTSFTQLLSENCKKKMLSGEKCLLSNSYSSMFHFRCQIKWRLQEMQDKLFKCLNKTCEVSVWSLWKSQEETCRIGFQLSYTFLSGSCYHVNVKTKSTPLLKKKQKS